MIKGKLKNKNHYPGKDFSIRQRYFLLKKYNIKVTHPRKELLEAIIFLRRKHFSTDDILNYLKRRNKNVSRASVYRTLNLFSKKGVIKLIDLGKQFRIYELAFKYTHHDHLYCLKCDKVIEFEEKKIEELQRKVCRRKGFYPLSHNLRIVGLCKECKDKNDR